MSKQVDVLPSHRGDLPQQRKRFSIVAPLIPLQQRREQNRVVGDDDIGDQPATLVADRDGEISAPEQLFAAADLGERRAQLMVGLDAVLRAMDVALKLGVEQVVESGEAANQLVEFEDRLAVWLCWDRAHSLRTRVAWLISLRPSVATIRSMLAFSAVISWLSI